MSGRWKVMRKPGDPLGWWWVLHPSGKWAQLKPTWREAFDYADRMARAER